MVGLARRLEAPLQLLIRNFACNSPATISNVEFTALKSQRFQTLLNLHPIELHATFLRPCPAAAHGCRSQVLHLEVRPCLGSLPAVVGVLQH